MADKEQMVSMSEVMKLIKEMHLQNLEQQKEVAREMAYNIVHPQPTEAEAAKKQELREAAIELARLEEETKKRKRARCPHRRLGSHWGLFNGNSTIAWHYTQFTKIDENGVPGVGPMVALGVCQWCQSEFKPGDADYAEKLSWGASPVESHMMDASTGLWQNG